MLVMQVSERWESLGSEAIKLISKEFNFLCLLLDDIHKLTLVCDLLDLLGGILSAAIIPSLRLETHDLFALIHVLL